MPRSSPSPTRIRRPRRARAVVVGLGVIALLAAGCGGNGEEDESEVEAISLISTAEPPIDVDLGEPGESPGDLNVFEAELEDAQSGEPAGRLYGVQTSVAIRGDTEIVQADITLDLEDGDITVGGVSEYPRGGADLVEEQEFVRPIVGGTGAYADAGGTLTTYLRPDGRYEQDLRVED